MKVIRATGRPTTGRWQASIDDPQRVRSRRRTSVDRRHQRICGEHGTALEATCRGASCARPTLRGAASCATKPPRRTTWESGYCAMGDFGHIDDEGYLWLSGRVRELVIRGGQNIVPAEIEDAILRTSRRRRGGRDRFPTPRWASASVRPIVPGRAHASLNRSPRIWANAGLPGSNI